MLARLRKSALQTDVLGHFEGGEQITFTDGSGHVPISAHWSVVRDTYLACTAVDALLPHVGFKVLLVGALRLAAARRGETAHADDNGKGNTKWKTAQRIRAVLAFLNVKYSSGTKNPTSRSNYLARPEQRESLSHAHKTAEQVLRASKTFKSKKKKTGVATLLTEGELDAVPFAMQGDVLMETNACRRDRATLKKDETIKQAILRWWIALGFVGFRPQDSGSKFKRRVEKTILPTIRLAALSANKIMSAATLLSSRSDATSASAPTRRAFGSGPGSASKRSSNSFAKDPRTEGMIGKSEYIKLFVALGHALLPADADDVEHENEHTREYVRQVNEAEWKRLAKKDFQRDAGGMKFMSYEQFFNAIFELVDLHTYSIEADEYVAFLDRTLELLPHPLVH